MPLRADWVKLLKRQELRILRAALVCHLKTMTPGSEEFLISHDLLLDVEAYLARSTTGGVHRSRLQPSRNKKQSRLHASEHLSSVSR